MITSASNKSNKPNLIKKSVISLKDSITPKTESRNSYTRITINTPKTFNFKKSIPKIETDEKIKFDLKRIKVYNINIAYPIS